MRFSFSISHVPGSQLHTADTLSRAPNMDGSLSHSEVKAYVDATIQCLPASDDRIEQIKQEQKEDPECK